MMASWEIRPGPGRVCVVCLIQIAAAGEASKRWLQHRHHHFEHRTRSEDQTLMKCFQIIGDILKIEQSLTFLLPLFLNIKMMN